jgi:hypothetical protein
MTMSPSEPIATFIIKDAWVSPNAMLKRHWGWKHKRKQGIANQIAIQLLMLPRDVYSRVSLREPKKRRMDFVVCGRGHKIDPDNLVGGLKVLIDCFKRVQQRQYRVGTTRNGRPVTHSALYSDGPGVIWNDGPDWFELGSVEVDRATKTPRGRKDIIVRVYDA